MLDLSITLAFLPRYWKIGCASVESDDIDEDYNVISYTIWLFILGITATFTSYKDEE